MDSLIEQLAIANQQMFARQKRLTKFYSLNAPQPIIENEFKLIREAGEKIRTTTLALKMSKQN